MGRRKWSNTRRFRGLKVWTLLCSHLGEGLGGRGGGKGRGGLGARGGDGSLRGRDRQGDAGQEVSKQDIAILVWHGMPEDMDLKGGRGVEAAGFSVLIRCHYLRYY